MSYRVSTSASGERLWWLDHEAIPAAHTDVRDATAEEAAVMDKIARAKRMPSLALGEKIQKMLG